MQPKRAREKNIDYSMKCKNKNNSYCVEMKERVDDKSGEISTNEESTGNGDSFSTKQLKTTLPESTNPLSNKIQKALSKVLEDDKDLLASLVDVSSLLPNNSLASRRALRSTMERRSVEINEKFLEAAAQVREALALVAAHVQQAVAVSGSVVLQVSAARGRGSRLLAETRLLSGELSKLEARRRLLHAFTARFQLTNTQLEALTSSQLDLSFFPALERTKTIHADAERLLRSGSRPDTALEVMEQMSCHQEAAYDRLYNWAKSRVRCPDLEIDSCLQQAMQCLQERPVLFEHVLEEYCSGRRRCLSRRFISALTGSGHSRPIELHAHEPERYVGEMLAWLHQAAPGERALLHQLGGAGAALGVWSEVCGPVRSRLQQTLSSCSDVTVLRRLCSLLQYYAETALPTALAMTASEHGAGPLGRVLHEGCELAAQSLAAALRARLQVLCERVQAGERLQPCEAVRGCLRLLKEAATVDNRELVLEQLLEAVSRAASSLSAHHSPLFQLNCLHALSDALPEEEEGGRWVPLLQQRQHSQLERLTSEQASATLHALAVAGIFSRLQEGPPPPLSQQPGLEPASIGLFLQRLDLFLANPDLLALPQLHLLNSARLRQTVRSRTCEALLVVYQQLYQQVNDPGNQYPPELMPRPPHQLRQLLGI